MPAEPAAPPTPTTCSVCGTSVPGPPPLTWSLTRTERGTSCACDDCTRRHVRSMEAQLEQEHW